jgi:hypothetical protein
MRKIWVDSENHTVPVVCYGKESNCIIYSVPGAKEVGEALLAAAKEAEELSKKTEGAGENPE